MQFVARGGNDGEDDEPDETLFLFSFFLTTLKESLTVIWHHGLFTALHDAKRRQFSRFRALLSSSFWKSKNKTKKTNISETENRSWRKSRNARIILAKHQHRNSFSSPGPLRCDRCDKWKTSGEKLPRAVCGKWNMDYQEPAMKDTVGQMRLCACAWRRRIATW